MTWQTKLLAWYRRHRRDLPWRRTRDPYAIWISEIMLQQTTVQAVIPYYERFLKRFPTVQDLAGADEEEILKFWSGLGYYSRARNLHQAARLVGDRLPDTVEGLMALPGVGRYTAGAIASIAFERRAPLVDGNVARVFSRFFGITKDPKSPEGQKTFWKAAEESLPSHSPGDHNQALMELGATVCTPENPTCVFCPLQEVCVARKKGRPEEFPIMARKKEYLQVKLSAAVILDEKAETLLLVRRPRQGLLKGMWEFPMAEGCEKSLQKAWPVRVVKALRPVRHSILNKRLEIVPHVCRLNGRLPRETLWVHPQDFQDLSTSSMNRKILQRFQERP